MFMRLRKTGAVYRARLNGQVHIGCRSDPLLEIRRAGRWVGLLPQQLARRFEILAASPREVNQLALLTEYALSYSRHFTIRLGSVRLIGLRRAGSH